MPHSPRDRRFDNLPDAQAARLLERASELDAVRRNELAIADLRAAALEAGISAEAFEAALAEMHVGSPSQAATGISRRPARRRRWTLTLAAVALIMAGMVGVLRERGGAVAAEVARAGLAEEAIVLQCLTPGEAATLLRPILRDGSATIRSSPASAPRVLTIRAPQPTLEQAKRLLAEHESSGSAACALPTDTRRR